MMRALYPGSFDPVTNGHLDVLTRACKLFDEVIVGVAHHNSKQSLFSPRERAGLLQEATIKLPNAHVVQFDGLLVDFAKSQGVRAIIRGLRAVSDFEFEFQMALMNRSLAPEMETLFLMPSEETTYLSSRMVKEVARLGGDISRFVPECVRRALQTAFLEHQSRSPRKAAP